MPTIKQKKAFDNIVENRGNVSKGMKEAGYEENTAKNPKNLTDSNGWQELLDEKLPDSLLSKVHSEGLEASKGVFKNNNETKKVERVDEEPDFGVRHKYLDTAYKLKNKYPAVKTDITSGGKVIAGFNFIKNEGNSSDNPSTSETRDSVGDIPEPHN